MHATNVNNRGSCVFKYYRFYTDDDDGAIPYEAFNLTKKSDFVENAMDRFISINKIRLENFVQVW